MSARDLLFPYIDKRVKTFGIKKGMTVVDYGCGPGRYTIRFAKLVGDTGKVYAVDIHELAIETVEEKIQKQNVTNVEPILAKGYDSRLPDHVADRVTALDMFFAIPEPTTFLKELHRITKPDGVLIIDDGHQPRKNTKEKILASNCWQIVKETPDHIECKPL